MNSDTFLDPVNEKIDSSTFMPAKLALVNKIHWLQKHEYLIKAGFVICCLLPVLVLFFLGKAESSDIKLFFYSFIPIVIFIAYLRSVQKEVILYLLCEKKGWAYNPQTDSSRVDELGKLFPEIFTLGTDQDVDNQIWGKLDKPREVHFWEGLYTYDTGSGRSRSTHHKSVFIIRLDEVLPSEFTLYRSGFTTDMKTKSEEFNKLYKIKIKDQQNTPQQDIMRMLSPSVQVRLIDFARKFYVERIVFRQNCMAVLFRYDVWSAKHTNFLKRVMIDERDIQLFDDLLLDMIRLPAEMIRFLD